MSDGLEDAYTAVERAYGQGDYTTALQLATDLLEQVPTGRDDLLDHRLHLLIGHIHGFGLGQPAEAAAAYALVLATCTNPAYRDLASQGLAHTGGASPDTPDPGGLPAAEAQPTSRRPAETTAATPWLSEMQTTSDAGAAVTAGTAAGPALTAIVTTAPGAAAAPPAQALQSPAPQHQAMEREAMPQSTVLLTTTPARRFSDDAWAELNRCLLVIELNDSLSGSDG